MTETLLEPPPPPPPTPPPAPPGVRLVRDPADKVVAGVCAGLGRSTGTDPVLWRVLIAVLVLFGGAGLLLYALGWLLVPKAGAPESFVERVVRGGAVPTATAAVVALLAVVTLGAVSGDGAVPLALLVLGAIAVLAVRERSAAPPRPVVPWPDPAPVVAAPPRERSALGLLTLSAALLVVGLLLLAGQAGLDGVTPPRVLAAALLVVGGGLLVGTWYGRARWLLLPGVLLAVLSVGSAAAAGPYGWSAGEVVWTPASDGRADYRLGVGEATLDLRGLAPGELDRVDVQVGAGHVLVLVPDDLPVRIDADVEAGEVADDDVRPSPTGPPTVIDVELRVGMVEVRRAAA